MSSVGRASRLHREGQRFESVIAYPSEFFLNSHPPGKIAQVVRVLACHARCRGFESRFSRLMIDMLIYFSISVLLSVVLLGISFVVSPQSPDPEKRSAYECGFDPFEDSRGRFDIKFYLVAILFLIFDLEVSFLFPWAVSLHNLNAFGFWTMMVFLGILTLGFVYEWQKGALEWE